MNAGFFRSAFTVEVERLRKMKEEERDRVLATTQRKRVQAISFRLAS